MTTTQAIYEAMESKRRELRLTETQLCEGICSVRTYRRYIYEDTDMPFTMLEALTERLGQHVYDVLYYVEHRLKMDHMDEVLLLDTLIQDDYDQAITLYEAFKKSGQEIIIHPFLLPLMLDKLKAYQDKLPFDTVHKKMLDALKLDVLKDRPFLSVEQIKLMEHIIPFAPISDLLKMDHILLRIMNQSMRLIRASKYTMVKCYQLHFQIVMLSEPLDIQVKTLKETLKRVYMIGGELAIDEILLQAKTKSLHILDKEVEVLFKKYYIASSFMYHTQNPLEDREDMNYLQSIGVSSLFDIHAFKVELEDALS